MAANRSPLRASVTGLPVGLFPELTRLAPIAARAQPLVGTAVVTAVGRLPHTPIDRGSGGGCLMLVLLLLLLLLLVLLVLLVASGPACPAPDDAAKDTAGNSSSPSPPRHLCLLSVPSSFSSSDEGADCSDEDTKPGCRFFGDSSASSPSVTPSSSAIVITADDAGADADADVDVDVDVDADTDADTGADGCTLLTAAKATLAAHELGFAATTEDNDDAVAEDDGPTSLAAASVIDEVPDTAAPAVASATCWLFCCCGCCGCCCVAADDDDAADTAGGLVGRAVLRVLPMPQGSRGSRFTDGGEFDDAPPPLASLLLAASLPPLPPLARSCC